MRRAGFHAFNAALVLAVLVLADERFIHWTASCAFAFVWLVELVRRHHAPTQRAVLRTLGPVVRPHERTSITSGTWFVSALFVLAHWAPIEARLVGVAVIGFGDPLASLVGRRFGRGELWGRSLAGSATMAVVAALVAGIVAWSAGLPIAERAAWVAIASVLAELLSRRGLDDNLFVPIAAAAAWLVA